MPPPLRLELLSPPPVLRTERLRLRPLRPGDAPAMLRLRGDPLVMRHMGTAPLPDLAAAHALIDTWLERQAQYECSTWAITFGEADELIGSVSAFKFDGQHRKAEIGYSLLPIHWRRGYTHEALRVVLRWLFDTFRAHRVVAEIDPQNLASAALLCKLGFRREAYFREAFLVDEAYTDSEIYGRLASDAD